MRFFVHHHVDLEMMELKTTTGRYKSLDELRGDAATVFHNVMLCFDGLYLSQKSTDTALDSYFSYLYFYHTEYCCAERYQSQNFRPSLCLSNATKCLNCDKMQETSAKIVIKSTFIYFSNKKNG